MEAKCLLGYCYREGIGVEKNLDIAYKLFTESAEGGNEMAKENLKNMK